MAALTPARLPCPLLFDRYPEALTFALDHAVFLRAGVVRPGLYPLADPADLPAALAFAGAPSAKTPTERRRDSATVPDRAAPGTIFDLAEATVALDGHVRDPGLRPLRQASDLRALLGTDARALRPGAYGLLGVIERFDRHSLARRLLPFAPAAVLAGRREHRLHDGDRVLILSSAAVRARFSADTPDAGTVLSSSGATGDHRPSSRSGHSARGGSATRAAYVPGPWGAPAAVGTVAPGRAAPDPLADADLLSLLAEHAVRVRGAVRAPGRYPVAGDQPLAAVLEAAGGLTADADRSRIEVLRNDRHRDRPERATVRADDARATTVAAGDAVRVAPRVGLLEAGAVVIAGEVRAPGTYDFRRGETLSSLLARAGGLTAQAYPAGAVFTRDSVRQAERQRFLQAARELDRLAALSLLERDGADPAQAEAARRLAADLRTADAVGRITVEADPVVLALRPALDILLQDGDRITIPKRPLTVTVAGEVLVPGARQFETGKTADAYLDEAGGLTRYADEERAFIVYPDGRAQPLDLSAWKFTPIHVPPGATVFVPRDPKPLDVLELSDSLSSILSQLAISAASLSVIQRP